MAFTVAQIIAAACTVANCPGYTAQAGHALNLILQEIAQSYSFESAQGFLRGTFFSGIGGAVNSAPQQPGQGPYQLPADFLSMDFGDFFYQNGNINYFPTPMDRDEFDSLNPIPGTGTLPSAYFIDMSTTPAGLYVWPPPGGAYPFFGRYSRQMADIAAPDTTGGTTVPWFPSQAYIERRLTGEMMNYTGDVRAAQFLGDEKGMPAWSASGIMKAYKTKEGNMDTRTPRVHLDPRSFGPRWNQLARTKDNPW